MHRYHSENGPYLPANLAQIVHRTSNRVSYQICQNVEGRSTAVAKAWGE
jgi:hypothetical protein